MAWEDLKDYINDKIRDKLPAKISADNDHNPTLHQIVDTFGLDYIYSGIADKTTTPINDDKLRYYIANGSTGDYVNFKDDGANVLSLDTGEWAIFKGSNNVWTKNTVHLPLLFTVLEDTPSDYTGSGGFALVVKQTEDGIEFIETKQYTQDEKDKVDYISVTKAVDLDSMSDKLDTVEIGATTDQDSSEVDISDYTKATSESAIVDGDTVNDALGKLEYKVDNQETDPEFNTLKVGDVAGGDYAEIDGGGQIRLYGDATQWEDLKVPVLSTKSGGTKDPNFKKAFDNGSGSQGVFTYYFDPNVEEELYFAVQLPHNWMIGSDIEPHVHWIPEGNGAVSELVSWGLEYTWADIGGVFGNTTILYSNTHFPADSAFVDGKHYITGLGSISGTGKTFSSMLICRVFRDATGSGETDSYTSDAGLLEVDFHYQVDSFGTNEEYVKYTLP